MVYLIVGLGVLAEIQKDTSIYFEPACLHLMMGNKSIFEHEESAVFICCTLCFSGDSERHQRPLSERPSAGGCAGACEDPEELRTE